VTLPNGWRRTTLGDLGRYLNGRAFKRAEWRDEGRPIVRIQNLTGSSDTFNYFQGEADDRHVVRPGDLLVSWAATLGAYLWDGPEAVLNQHIFKVESRIDKRFHKYLLDHKLDELKRHTHGSGMVHITRRAFDSLPVHVPDLGEQRRIVAVLEDHLSRLNAADAYARSATQRLANVGRSALDRLFGGQDVPLAGLIDDISAGKSYGAASAPAADDEWGIIKVSAMTWGKFDPAENKAVPGDLADPRFEIREGDLLVSRANTNEYVGASVLVGPVRPRLLLSDKSLRVSPADGVRPDWLWRALQAPSARRQISALATGTKDSMRNISQASLMQVRVPRATPQEQAAAVSAYAEIAAAVDRFRTELDSAHRRSAGLGRSLLAAAFSGQLTDEMAPA